MLVYGDHDRTVDPRELLVRLAEPAHGHAAIVARFIAAAELAQGLADATFTGIDARSPLTDAAMRACVGFARQVEQSWRGMPIELVSLDELAAHSMPDAITCKRAEGYAFYALYPETYLEAARRAPRGPRHVVGIRSIGTGLAALVAAGTHAPVPATVRPVGDPFRREVRVHPSLLAEWRTGELVAIADEGPGMSGSSFGAVADLVERQGARCELYPSHPGDLGPMALPRHRERYKRIAKHHVSFEEVILPRLLSWIGELVGKLTVVKDVSAGGWRAIKYPTEAEWPATVIQQERRKLLVTSKHGRFLARFVGLAHDGDRALSRARSLYAVGFTPEPAGLVHGFLVERWHDDTRPLAALDRRTLVERVGEYLAFRASAFPGGTGADVQLLRTMVRKNTGIDVSAPTSAPRRVEIDGRLHAHEWLLTGRGLLKADAYDHHAAHDLVGCQDIAWDVAGAAAELGLTSTEETRLASMCDVDREQLAFAKPCYAAFQLGRHALAIDSSPPPEQARLRAEVERYRALATRTGLG
jgi:hypothetical protein